MSDDDLPAFRRQPGQQRSRDRVEHILDVAAELIVRDGIDATSMSALAKAAKVSLPSIYRYFPNKQAILHTLLERTAQRVRAMVLASVGDVGSTQDALAGMTVAMRAYWQLFRDDPTFAGIWAAAASVPALVQQDLEDTRLTGGMLAEAVRDIVPADRAEHLDVIGYMCVSLATSSVRLAAQLPDADAEVVITTMTDRILPAALGLPPRTD
ncbi:TetR/AcrR family transcriptional regulator [Angustibacter luteus]|uniref:TetR/AcrR family transcriptional regulator n=1 Tax=Angustibacter luteus TaxID=658456 RepID=A0ABW1JHQ7_9ACTN